MEQIIPVLSMLIGIIIGFRLRKDEKPVPNPITIVKDEIIQPIHDVKRTIEDNIEITKISRIMDNLNNYNGSSKGQKKVSK